MPTYEKMSKSSNDCTELKMLKLVKDITVSLTLNNNIISQINNTSNK